MRVKRCEYRQKGAQQPGAADPCSWHTRERGSAGRPSSPAPTPSSPNHPAHSGLCSVHDLEELGRVYCQAPPPLGTGKLRGTGLRLGRRSRKARPRTAAQPAPYPTCQVGCAGARVVAAEERQELLVRACVGQQQRESLIHARAVLRPRCVIKWMRLDAAATTPPSPSPSTAHGPVPSSALHPGGCSFLGLPLGGAWRVILVALPATPILRHHGYGIGAGRSGAPIRR